MLPQTVGFDRPFEHNWLLIGDYYFFVMYSMVVMGFVMVFEWDALFPDRKDYLIPHSAAARRPLHLLRQAAALVSFLGLFAIDANFFCTLLAPLVTGGEGTLAPVVWRLIGVHASRSSAAGTFVALSIREHTGRADQRAHRRGFRRVSPWVQMTLMGGLIVVLFLTPLACASIRPLVESHSPLLRWFPPFWFLALYLDMLPGQPAARCSTSWRRVGAAGLAIAAAAFALTYLAGYQRHARRVMESVEAPARARTAARWFEPVREPPAAAASAGARHVSFHQQHHPAQRPASPLSGHLRRNRGGAGHCPPWCVSAPGRALRS